jgi:tetratricopeptide (TPR) repeat protein
MGLELFMASRLPAQNAARDHAGWWIETFGVLEPSIEPRVARARRVFARILAVADRSAARDPRLVIIGDAPPLALALPDGTVLLTRSGLNLAYDGVADEVGDARLALVFGHELVHLAKDDFWHAFAAAAVSRVRAEPEVRSAVQRDLRPGHDDSRRKELQADGYGLLYALMAGYSPAPILERDAAFLWEWGAKGWSGEKAPPTHPSPKERSLLLAGQYREIQEQIDVFRFGIRLYQLGRYEDAIALLERVRDHFPSREVMNAIGLSQYQLALRAQAECEGEVLRFRLPTRLDPTILTRSSRMRGRQEGCGSDSGFQHNVDEAIRHLQRAVEMNAAYSPGRVNLSSALIVAGEYPRAMDVTRKAIEAGLDDPDILHNRALAHFAYGRQTRIEELTESALTDMQALWRANPRDAGIAYDLAVMLTEKERSAQALEMWSAFLGLETEGPYADIARRRLGAPRAERPGGPPAAVDLPAPPLPLGIISERTAASLRKLQRRTLELGSLRGAIYRGRALRALEINAALEIVELDLDQAQGGRDVLGAWGPPAAEIPTSAGRTLVYPGFAVDLVDDVPATHAFFRTAPLSGPGSTTR